MAGLGDPVLDRLAILPFDPRGGDVNGNSVVLSGKLSALSTLYLPSMVNFSILPKISTIAGLLSDAEAVSCLLF